MGEQRKREQNDSYHFDPKQSVPLCASRRGCSRAGKSTGKRENNWRITERSKQKNKWDSLQGGKHCCVTVPSLSFPKADAVGCCVTDQARPSVWPRPAISRAQSPLLHCCQFYCFVMWPCANPFLLFLSPVIHQWAGFTASVVVQVLLGKYSLFTCL